MADWRLMHISASILPKRIHGTSEELGCASQPDAAASIGEVLDERGIIDWRPGHSLLRIIHCATVTVVSTDKSSVMN